MSDITSVSPNSIHDQLQEYRRRKKMQLLEEKTAIQEASNSEATPLNQADAPPTGQSDHGGSDKRKGFRARFKNVEIGLFSFVSIIDSFLNTVGEVISDAVLPDHLKGGPRGGGRLLNDERLEGAEPLIARQESRRHSLEDDGSDDEDDSAIVNCGGNRWRWWVAMAVKVAAWLLVWQVFIWWQFGAVYFLLTGFVLIWTNLRSDPPLPGELSAYSVFNRNQQRIHGTVTAEQLQREMLIRL